MRTTGGAGPVVIHPRKAMQGRSKEVVEGAQCGRLLHLPEVKKAGVLRSLLTRLFFHGLKEVGAIDPLIQAAINRVATGRQIQWGREGTEGIHPWVSGLSSAREGGPPQQGISAQTDAHCKHRPRMAPGERLEEPAHLLRVPGVIGPRRSVERARAAPEVRDGKGPSPLARNRGKGPHIVA